MPDFSPFIKREARRRFLKTFNISYHVLSPAVLQIHDKVLIAFRVWRGYLLKHPTASSFPQDLVYVQEYTRDLRPTRPGYFLANGYPIGRNKTEYLFFDGPQDPRAFELKCRLYLTFHDGVPQTDHKLRRVVRTLMWDLETNRPTVLMVKHNVLGTPLSDKNWMSLVMNDTLYFIQYLDPLLIAKCSINGSCMYLPNLPHFRPSDPRIQGFMDPILDVLRGGTPLAHYSDNYYIAFVHCKHTKSLWPYQVSAYTSHIILFNNFRIVFINGHIPLNPELYRGRRRTPAIHHSFYYPTSMVVESPDSLLVFAHLNDDSSCLLRVNGVEKLLSDVMRRDKIISPKTGPPPQCLQKLFKSKNDTYVEFMTTIK